MNTKNNQKSVLIIPDLHLAWKVGQKIIDHVGADEIIFLGDFFDDFNDDPNQINEMVDWLEGSVTKPNRIHLFGNHDCHYAFPQEWFRCSGYEQWKHFIIRDRIDNKVWDKFKFYHVLDGKWLLSHAGLHKMWLHKNIIAHRKNRTRFFQEITDYLDNEIEKGMRNESWVFHAGFARWGIQRVGGLTWCDHTQEMYPVLGLHQIYGHTPQSNGTASWIVQDTPQCKPHFKMANVWVPSKEQINKTDVSYNLCLDVHGNTNWAIWNGSELSVHKFSDI